MENEKPLFKLRGNTFLAERMTVPFICKLPADMGTVSGNAFDWKVTGNAGEDNEVSFPVPNALFMLLFMPQNPTAEELVNRKYMVTLTIEERQPASDGMGF